MYPVDPEDVAAVYDMLRALRPFRRWKLPPSESVKFFIRPMPKESAEWRYDGTTHEVHISALNIGHLDNLVQSVAHEMIHISIGKPGHGTEFKRRAKLVCKWGFDPKSF